MHIESAETLRFLGRMNAHISHELKNILATISETAGLMEDLIEIGTQRNDLNPARLAELCGRITTLTTRGNATVRNMNQLAHSMDEPLRDSDANDEVALMAGISQYAPYARKVDLDLEQPDGLPLKARSLHLQHLLAELFSAAFTTLESDERLPVAVTRADKGACVTMQLHGNLPADSEELQRGMTIAGTLGARLELHDNALTLTLGDMQE